MTNPQSALPLLTDVERTQRRTRRRLDDHWFTFAAIGAALLVTGLTQPLLGTRWVAPAFVVTLSTAYLVIALRAVRLHRQFGRTGRVPLAPFAVSEAVAIGAIVLGMTLDGRTAIAAIAGWCALGCLVFAVWHRDVLSLSLAFAALEVGAITLLLDAGAMFSTVLYGVSFTAIAIVAWVLAGRRPR
jgi:hypothetical protein